MKKQDQRHAYTLIGYVSFVFSLGMLVSGFSFYEGRPFDWKDAVISHLQSPEDNPRGYLSSTLATAVAGLLFLWLTAIFHRWSRRLSETAARVGSGFFGLGALGALAIGGLSPFPHVYETVHVPLAFATFFLLVTGLGSHLLLAGRGLRTVKQRGSIVCFGCCALIGFTLGALLWTYRDPNFFTGEDLLRTLALWEWLLCASIVGFLVVLVRFMGRIQTAEVDQA